MKKIIFTIIACGTLWLNGCSNNDNERVLNAYAFGMTDYAGTLTDMQKVHTYLQSKGCYLDPMTFEGVNDADTDRQAKQVFDETTANISKSGIAALGLDPSSRFTYTVSRVDRKTGETLTIGIFAYP